MSIRDEVLTVLRGRETTRIRFNFTSFYGTPVAVDQITFQRVVSAIESGRIQVPETGVAANAGGEYDNTPVNGGIFYGRPVRNRRTNKSIIIHEAVHASFDLTGSILEEVDNEAASFLAQFIYLRLTAYPISRLLARNPEHARLYESVWNASASVFNGGTVPANRMQQIRQRMVEDGHYPTLLTEGCVDGQSPCEYSFWGANG